MHKSILFLPLLLFQMAILHAQMWNGQDTLYGNEWIQERQQYFKISVAEDGMYRLDGATLAANGVPVGVLGNQFQLFHLGEEVPIFTSTAAAFSESDFIEFYGKKNRAELDKFLYRNANENLLLNPEYSLFNDTAAYFLTWTEAGTPTERYETLQNDLSNPPAKAEQFTFEQKNVYSEFYIKEGGTDGSSQFESVEGFADFLRDSRTLSFTLENAVENIDSAEVYLRLATDNGSHQLRVTANNQSVIEENFFGYQLREYRFAIPVSGNTPTVELKIEGLNSNTDRHVVANVFLEYPHQFSFTNASNVAFALPAKNSPTYLEIEDFDRSGNTPPVLYDLTNQQRLEAVVAGNTLRFLLPPSSNSRNLVLVNPTSGVQKIEQLEAVQFTNFANESAEFLILSHSNLRTGNTDQVQEYANYRRSSEGGNFTTQIVNVDDLYEQFGYGVNRHPQAIRNFAHFIQKHWQGGPEYVFIIGKGREYRFIRQPEDLERERQQNYFFIPTYGWPGADNLLFANNYDITPLFPIGRIAATTPAEVRLYLEKVKTFERLESELDQTIEDKGWMKRIIHLGGGNTAFEQSTIRSHLTSMGDIMEENTFAGSVSAFYKSSSDPVQVSQSGQINELFNSGISLLTFFGHSNSNTFDFNIDDPGNLKNQNRYPVIVSLGCFAGRMHGDFRSLGENYIFSDNRGAIGFLASTSLGYISDLRNFGENYYRRLGNSMYGEPMGKIVQEIIRQNDNGVRSTMNFLMQQMTFQGDPALRLNAQPGPDFVVDATSVKINPSPVNVQLDSFQLQFEVVNLGRKTDTPIQISIEQELPGGEKVLVAEKVRTVRSFAESVQVTVPTLGAKSVGQNRFFIKLDTQNEVAELPAPAAESNNSLRSAAGEEGFRFFVFSNDVAPLYPQNFGIVGQRNLTFKASTLNAFAERQRYLFELDTTATFDSPVKMQAEVEQSGGVLEWQTSLSFPDSTVYYWRISPDSTSQVGYTWKMSSFLFLENASDGWNQSHYYQFTENDYDNLELTEQRRFSYVENISEVKIKTGFFSQHSAEIILNNNIIQSYTPATISTGVYIAVFDPVDGSVWQNEVAGETGGQFGSYNLTGNPINVFPFRTNSLEERTKIVQFLTEVVPDDHYVAFFTIQRTNRGYEPELWAADSTALSTNIFQVLEAQGAGLVRSLAENEMTLPYIFVYRKNNEAFAPVELRGEPQQEIEARFDISGRWFTGTIRSPRIGPAAAWQALHWQTDAFNPAQEKQWVNIYGVQNDGTATLIEGQVTDFEKALNDVDAEEFPYLQLEYFSEDDSLRTTPQLEHWRILYEGLPEAALDPAAFFVFEKDTLQQGELLNMRIGIENVSRYDMDSLLVLYRITDNNNDETVIKKRLRPLLQNDTLVADLQYDTEERFGEQTVVVEVNPDNDQPELTHVNNIGVYPFFIERDKRNPLLDVTFDGVHIMDGDIISPKPIISVALKDENPYLALADTALFNIQLRYPGELEYQRIPFDSDMVRFRPASGLDEGGSNRAVVEFTPNFSKEGTYTLIIQARDASGNFSGAVEYRVSFEVILRTAISNVLNYPNPFTTSTHFVYTLTGDVPDYFAIQIMTVSGRIVREITQAELGPLRIGTHQTDYAWDGTDEFGDPLANGVYLYRIIAKKASGEVFEQHETGADRFFEQNIGKLVILR